MSRKPWALERWLVHVGTDEMVTWVNPPAVEFSELLRIPVYTDQYGIVCGVIQRSSYDRDTGANAVATAMCGQLVRGPVAFLRATPDELLGLETSEAQWFSDKVYECLGWEKAS